MTGRIPFGLLTLLTALVCVPVQAQGPMGAPPGYGVQPAGFQSMHDTGGQYRPLPPAAYQMGQMGPGGMPPRMTYEELPDDLGFGGHDTPLGNWFTETFRHAWFRGEYLLWDISGPNGNMLSEPTSADVPNNLTGADRFPSAVENVDYDLNSSVNGVTGTTQIPGLGAFSNRDMNGFRGTFGLPTPVGTMEFSGWLLGGHNQTRTEGIGIPGSLIQTQVIGNPAVTPGSTVGSDGNPATNDQTARFITQIARINGSYTNLALINYDVSYQSQLNTSAWGTEGNFVLDSLDPNSMFQLRPTFGFRYLNLRDRLLQNGQYNEPSASDATVNTVVTRQINSAAMNNIYGPQVGLRAEFGNSQFLLGFEPKLMMGLNTWQSNLDTFSVFSSTDTAQSLLLRNTTFTPLVDLKGYSNVAISKNLSFFIAYNFIWVGSTNRSYNNFIYNQNTAGNSDFRLTKTYQATTLQGVSLGFDFRY